MMENRKTLLPGLLKRVGNFDISNLGGRIICQKTVYLLQKFGIDLSYKFDWYIYGPYSKDLADESYAIACDYADAVPIRFADNLVEQRFRDYLNFLEPIKDDSYKIELVASIIMLYECGLKREEIREKIREKHTYFKDTMHEYNSEFFDMWEYSRKNGFVN
jgi:uncharacterized protein YwgA